MFPAHTSRMLESHSPFLETSESQQSACQLPSPDHSFPPLGEEKGFDQMSLVMPWGLALLLKTMGRSLHLERNQNKAEKTRKTVLFFFPKESCFPITLSACDQALRPHSGFPPLCCWSCLHGPLSTSQGLVNTPVSPLHQDCFYKD